MMDWEDVRVQLIDLPPITADFYEPYVTDLVRARRRGVLVLDLGDDDGPFAAEAVLERLAERKTILVGSRPEADEDPTVYHVKTLLVANKVDADGAADRLEIAAGDVRRPRSRSCRSTAEHGRRAGGAAHAAFTGSLNVIRVYTQAAGQAGRHDVPVHAARRAARCVRVGRAGPPRPGREAEVGPGLGHAASSTARR